MGSKFSRSGVRVSSPSRRSVAFLLTLGFLVFVVLVPSASASPKRIVSKIGSPAIGETGGQLAAPSGVAVNQSGAGGVAAGTMYVVDAGNLRIQRFAPDGAFVSAWGFGVVNGDEEPDICTKADECKRGSENAPEGAAGTLIAPRGIAVDQSNGNIYVSDQSARNRRIDIYSAEGAFEGAFGLGIKNNEAKLQYCTTGTGCRRPNIVGSFPGRGGAFPGAIGGVAVDAAGDVYVANTANRRVDVFEPTLSAGVVTDVQFLRSFGWGVNVGGSAEFEVCTVAGECRAGSSGAGLGQFATGSPTDVAVDSEGDVFALDAANKRVEEFNSVPAPVIASFGSAALEGVFGAGATLFNIAIDPSAAANHLLVSGGRIGSGGKVAIAELDHSGGNALGAGKAHGEDLPVAVAGGLATAKVSLGGNLYLSTGTPAVLQGVFVLNEVPTVEPVTGITGTTATFHGKVVSSEIDVTYHFEYSTDGKTWTRVPAADADAGAHPGEVAVQQEVQGLTGSQLYRVRLVQNRPLGGGEATSNEITFTTLPERPVIQGSVASPVRDTSATLDAYLNPQNEATSYHFEYGTADCDAVPDPCTALPTSVANGGGLRLVTRTATGLLPETVYHFRLIATNATGSVAGPDRAFETVPAGGQLPDGRAYELVTPPDTGAVVLGGLGFGEQGVGCFDMFPATADGDSVVSLSLGGSLPGLDVNGRWDLYESVRDPQKGWETITKSASTAQTVGAFQGLCSSPDHLFSTQSTEGAPLDEGSLVLEGQRTNYVRVPGIANPACTPEPGSHFELVGCGTLGVDAKGNARWITSGATHIVFTSKKQLEPEAPPTGTEAIYDRSPGAQTRVVSLLPGEVSPGASENAEYQGTSVDGSTVAFKLPANGALYARVDNSSTIGTPDVLVGETLNCTGGTSGTGAPALSYQWLRNGAAINGATAPSYTITTADEGAAVQCQVTAINTLAGVDGEFAGSTQASNPAAVVDPAPATPPPSPPSFIFGPTPSGSLTVPGPAADRTLTCNSEAWSGSTRLDYQWYQNGVAISGANGPTYVVAENSLNARAAFQCAVTGVNAGGAVTKVSFTSSTSPEPSPETPNASASTPSRPKTFAGISDDGSNLFYVLTGNVFDLDTESGAITRITDAGDVQLVNISGDGSHVYFISTAVLTGTEQNSVGRTAGAGKNNLYVWDRSSAATHFVAAVDQKDVTSVSASFLTRWTESAVSPSQNTGNGRANDTSRTTPDGSVLLFESRANVTGFDSGGHIEIYRYGPDGLDCVSCPPTGLPASSDARLQPVEGVGHPDSPILHVQNVTDDGRRVFFQTEDALVPGDVNGTWDVYEWKVGQQAYLISSGHSQLPSFLYGMTPSGSDVFFTTAERLVPQDLSTVISIYDARAPHVPGEAVGFPAASAEPPCQGDNCQGTPGVAPGLAAAGSASFQGPGNKAAKRKSHCRRSQRRVKRMGKIRCVKRHRHKVTKRHRKASHNGRAR